jgi:hypothetical protein
MSPPTPRTNLMRYRANPVLFIEEVLINPETARPFVLLPAEKKFLKICVQARPKRSPALSRTGLCMPEEVRQDHVRGDLYHHDSIVARRRLRGGDLRS